MRAGHGGKYIYKCTWNYTIYLRINLSGLFFSTLFLSFWIIPLKSTKTSIVCLHFVQWKHDVMRGYTCYRFSLHLNWNMTLFILNLAFADLLYCITSLPFYVIHYLFRGWPLGPQACYLFGLIRCNFRHHRKSLVWLLEVAPFLREIFLTVAILHLKISPQGQFK